MLKRILGLCFPRPTFAHALLKRGVRILERGAWFVSFVHDDAVIDATLDAVKGAAKDIAQPS